MPVSGKLYIVATPIGNLEDMSYRAIHTLKSVDLIAAEDTRHSQRLLQHYGINTKMQSLHEHNEARRIPEICDRLQNNQSIALISDAGTPLISDPGFKLVRGVRDAGFTVVPIPGPSALITALCAAGLPSDRFLFEGFLPATSSKRCKRLEAIIDESATLIFYESPHRILACIEDCLAVLGDREMVLARELTKTYETFLSGKASQIIKQLNADSDQTRGEFVVMVTGHEKKDNETDEPELKRLLEILLNEVPLKQAVKITGQITGLKKNQVYETALELKK